MGKRLSGGIWAVFFIPMCSLFVGCRKQENSSSSLKIKVYQKPDLSQNQYYLASLNTTLEQG